MASNDCVFQKSCNYVGKMLKIHQKRRDSLISVYLNRGKDANFNNGYCYVVA